MREFLDPFFDFVGDHILLFAGIPMGFAFLVILIVLPIQFFYGQERVVASLIRKLGFSESSSGLQKRDLRLFLHWSRVNKTDVLDVEYVAKLHEAAKDLTLSREGSQSGLAAKAGAEEIVTDDIDFDDFFWIERVPKGYLTPARRALLLDIFPKLSPDAHISKGRLIGRVRCEQSPFGVNNVVKMVRTAERLQREIIDPELPRARSVGWVRKGKCRQASIPFWLIGTPLFATSALLFMNSPTTAVTVLSVLIFLCSLAFLSTGLALCCGVKVALPLARVCQVLTSLALLAVAPFAVTPIGVVIGFGLALWGIHAIQLYFLSLTRLRLE